MTIPFIQASDAIFPERFANLLSDMADAYTIAEVDAYIKAGYSQPPMSGGVTAWVGYDGGLYADCDSDGISDGERVCDAMHSELSKFVNERAGELAELFQWAIDAMDSEIEAAGLAR